MQVSIKITAINSKWTNIQYLSSNAKSRLPTSKLLEFIDDGKFKISNPEMLDEIKKK